MAAAASVYLSEIAAAPLLDAAGTGRFRMAVRSLHIRSSRPLFSRAADPPRDPGERRVFKVANIASIDSIQKCMSLTE